MDPADNVMGVSERAERRGIFRGLGDLLKELFSKEGVRAEEDNREKEEEDARKKEEELERRINEVLALRKAEFRPTYEDIQTFCCVIGDENSIHRSRAHAAFYGFSDIVVPGTQIASMLEQYIKDATRDVEEVLGVKLNLNSVDIKLEAAVYPGSSLLWQVGKSEHKGNGIELTIEGKVSEERESSPKTGKIIPSRVRLTMGENGSCSALGGPILTERYVIREIDLNAFY